MQLTFEQVFALIGNIEKTSWLPKVFYPVLDSIENGWRLPDEKKNDIVILDKKAIDFIKNRSYRLKAGQASPFHFRSEVIRQLGTCQKMLDRFNHLIDIAQILGIETTDFDTDEKTPVQKINTLVDLMERENANEFAKVNFKLP